jgi:exodeoxyribonuclease VII large subunit
MRSRTWTVGALTRYIQSVLESNIELQDVSLIGELSGITRSTPGHLYFTLKDGEAALSCVMWRTSAARLAWQPVHGAAVWVHGRVSVYAARGHYQLIVDEMRPAGQGDLNARFEQLRDRLKAEGLFDAARKRPLPEFPRVLGIVTSPQAAALHDVLTILSRRYPLVRVRLAPTLVQGEQAAPQIVAALQALDAIDDVDAILVVRGGGSLEELWAFNDERVARAIVACRHPVVCGVGHETDFTIADFAADVRAPTPSAAAELAVPDRVELRQTVQALARQMDQALARQLGSARQTADGHLRALRRLSPQAQMDAYRLHVDELSRRLERVLGHALALQRARLAGLEARLGALSPVATLERGYAIVRRSENGGVISSVEQVTPGDALTVRVRDGEFEAAVKRP